MRGEGPARAILVAVIAGLFGWLLGEVLPFIGPQFAAIVSMVAAMAAEVMHRLADRGIWGANVRIAELGGAFLIAKLTHLALLGPALLDELSAFPTGLADPETTLGFLLMWVVRAASFKTIRDIRLLGSPGDETVGTAYDRVARRFRAIVGIGTLMAAFAVAGWQQIAILDRPAYDGLVWPLALILIIGVAALGAFRRIEDAGRWRRAGALVHDGVWLRWGSGVIVLTVATALTVVLFRFGVDEYARVPMLAIQGAAAAGSAVLRFLRIGDTDPQDLTAAPPIQEVQTQTDEGGFFDFLQSDEATTDGSGWGAAILTLAWVLAAFFLISLILAVLRNRRWIRSAFEIGPTEGLRAIVSEFVRMLSEMGRLLWQMLTFWRHRVSHEGDGLEIDVESGDHVAVGWPEWLAADAGRSRIAAAYHRFLSAAGNLLPRHRAETPDEYAAAVSDRLPFGAHQTGRLTSLFVEARYSHHQLHERDIEDAERLSSELSEMVDQPDAPPASEA